MRISFIGLGIMGLPMAKNLYKAGYLSKVYNRTKGKTNFFKNTNITISESPQEAAENTDIIFIMVSDSEDVEEVILGQNGVIHGANPGALVVDMSSINPEVSKKVEKLLGEKKVDMIDAPVSGGEKGAINGTLAIMAGGHERSVEKVKPFLQIIGDSIVHVGPIGSGGYVKLANQIIVGVELQAISEALNLSRHAGIDFKKLYQAIRYGLAGSNVLDQKINNFIKEDYTPGFKIKLHLKDIKNALQAANEKNIELPTTEQVKIFMEKIIDDGFGDADHSSLYQNLLKETNL